HRPGSSTLGGTQRALQIARCPHVEPLRLHGESLRRRLRRSELWCVENLISEHGHPRELWDDFSQYLKLLAAQLGQVEEDARDGAARSRQIPDVAPGHGIALEVHRHDRGAARGALAS